MLLITTGLFIEFARFLQIILWIVLPILLLALLTAVLIHRYRKRRAVGAVNTDGQSLFTSMENPGRGAYVLFDHSGLVRKYRNKLSYNQARYIALKHDFDKLEARYAAMAILNSSQSDNDKINTMKNDLTAIQPDTLELTSEKNELADRLEQLTRAYKALEEENESLLEQIQLQTATEDEKTMIVNRWKEENAELKTRASEQEYLQDIIDEKKRQIDFLQQQLEQRIKNYHQSEQQQSLLKKELERNKGLEQNHVQELHALKEELINKDENLEEKQQLLSTKADQLVYLENVLNELRQQNELSNAALADTRDLAQALQQQLEQEQSRVDAAEQKLAANRQLLQRLYKDLGAYVESSETVTVQSQIIILQTGEQAAESF
jgi:chromosome segregation ATPase